MRKKVKIFLRLTASLFVCFFVYTPVNAQEFTVGLKGAIDLAMENNLSLRSDSLNMAITGYNNKEIAGFYKPQVNYSSAAEYNPAIPAQLIPGSFLGDPSKDLVPVRMATKYNFRSGVEVSQALYRKDVLVQMRAAGLYNSISETKEAVSLRKIFTFFLIIVSIIFF